MADIYKEQVETVTPTVNIGESAAVKLQEQTAKVFDTFQQNFEDKAKKHQQLANTLYTDGSRLAIHSGLEELSRDPELSSNPQAFAEQADKLANDVLDQIDNNKIKAKVALDYELKKAPYVNNAYKNYYKKQREEQLAQTDEQVQSYFDTLSLSFGNLLDNTVSVDDFLNVKLATEGIDAALNQKDIQGYDLLTPSQRREIKRKKDKLLQNAVIGAINDAGYAQQMQLIDEIADDKFEMIKGLEKQMGSGKVQMGGLADYLTPESVEYVKKYARGVKARYSKLASSDKKNTGLSDREALKKAHTQTIFDLELPAELREIKKIDNDSERSFALMDGRINAEQLLKSGDIDEKTYQKYMQDSAVPLVDSIDSIEGSTSHWFRPNGALEDGINVLQTITEQTPEEKAYLYTNLYQELNKAGVEKDSSDLGDKERAKSIAQEIKQDFMDKKNANLIGTDVNRVLLGTDTLETYKQPKEPKPATNAPFKLWRREDGRVFKILPDKDGNYTSDSVAVDTYMRTKPENIPSLASEAISKVISFLPVTKKKR